MIIGRKSLKFLVQEGGLLLQGDAGKGKTYVAKQITKELGDRVKVIAPTNKAALNIGGNTIHSSLQMNTNGQIHPKLVQKVNKMYDYIIIDEISMISKELWKRICLLKRACPHLKFLLLGDDKQIPPVEEETYDDYFNHSAVKFLCNYKRNTLRVLKRYDIDLYNLLCDVNKLDTSMFGTKENRINICYYNSTRKAVNKLWNNREKSCDCLFVPEDIYNEYSQDMYVYPNLPVIATKTKKDSAETLYANSESFVVSGYDTKNIYIFNERPNDEGVSIRYELKLPIKEFSTDFVLNYCTSTHKSQGSTITDDFTIYDWEAMDTKLRYTALSQSKSIAQVSFGTGIKQEVHQTFKKNIIKKIEGHTKYDLSRGFKTDIEPEFIMRLFKKQNGCCNKCSCDMKANKYAYQDSKQFSIDRIDSSIGHTAGNIQLLCFGCNRSKRNYSY